MSNNKNLLRAKTVNNDEFYTCYDDIENHLSKYDFSKKVVYCNCDDWHFSNFFKYFYNNFRKLGLKKLLCTGYNDNGHGYYACYDGKVLQTDELFGNGDYKSDEAWLCLQACDIVVTNPPFSLFREYVKFLMDNRKQFIIIGSENGISYKETFPYIMNNKMWIDRKLVKKFIAPDGSVIPFGNICWYSNVISNIEEKPLSCTCMYSDGYKRYDNYDAIEVSSIKSIPYNYYGVMGVPVTYIKYHNPMEFDIVGLSSSSRDNTGKYFLGGKTTKPVLNGKETFTRVFIKRKENNLKKVG